MTVIGYNAVGIGRGPRIDGALGSSREVGRRPRGLELEATLTEDLLTLVAAGEPGAVERCLDRYGGLVWSLACRYHANRSDAEDATQEAFLSLWENAHRFDPSIASEGAFVAMICRRRIIDSVRRVARSQPRVEGANDTGPVPPSELPAQPSEAGVEYDGVSLRGFEVAEEADRVKRHMQQLREEERRVLEMAICQGLSQSRIAEITAWPLGTVKSHARRGMQRLRQLLQEDTTPVQPNAQEAAQ